VFLKIINNWSAISIEWNWKKYLTLNNDWSVDSDFSDYIVKDWDLSKLYKKFTWINWAWINWTKEDWWKVELLDISLLKSDDWMFYLYSVINNWITKYLWLKQTLDLEWNINILSDTTSNDVENFELSWTLNYDDFKK